MNTKVKTKITQYGLPWPDQRGQPTSFLLLYFLFYEFFQLSCFPTFQFVRWDNYSYLLTTATHKFLNVIMIKNILRCIIPYVGFGRSGLLPLQVSLGLASLLKTWSISLFLPVYTHMLCNLASSLSFQPDIVIVCRLGFLVHFP